MGNQSSNSSTLNDDACENVHFSSSNTSAQIQPQSGPKVKERTAASRGAAAFNPDNRGRQAQFGKQTDRKPRDTLLDEEILAYLNKNKACCSLQRAGHGCLAQHFLVDNEFFDPRLDELSAKRKLDTAVCSVVQRFRKVTRNLSSTAYDSEIQSLIRGAIQSRASDGDYVYAWRLSLLGGSAGASVGPIPVCKTIFLWVWGITDHHYKEVIKALKASDDGFFNASSVRRLDDSSRAYLPFSSNQIADMFESNVLDRLEDGTLIPARLGKDNCLISLLLRPFLTPTGYITLFAYRSSHGAPRNDTNVRE